MEVEFVEKETEAVVGEEGVLDMSSTIHSFIRVLIQRRLLVKILVMSSTIQRVELQQESYTKKATGKDVGYEHFHQEEELTRSSWRTKL